MSELKKYNSDYELGSNFEILFKSDQALKIEEENHNFFDDVKKLCSELDTEFSSKSLIILKEGKRYPVLLFLIRNETKYLVYISFDFMKGYLRLSEAFQLIEIGFVDFDKSKRIIERIYYNGRNYGHGITVDQIMNGNPINVSDADLKEFRRVFSDFVNENLTGISYFRTSLMGDKMQWFSFETIPFKNSDDNLIHGCIRCLDKFSDITEKKHQFIDENIFDSLTGIYNDQWMINYLKETLNSNNLDKHYFIGIVNIDGFSQMNRAYGNIFGDNVLKYVADILKKNLKPESKVARVGGDEFIFIEEVESGDHMVIRPLLKNLKLDLMSVDILDISNVNIPITVGVASYPNDGSNYLEVDTALRKAIYRGKMKGGDCYIIYNPDKHKDIDITEKIKKNISDSTKKDNNHIISDVINRLVTTENIRSTTNKILEELCEHIMIDRIILSDAFGNIEAQAVINGYEPLEKLYHSLDDNLYIRRFTADNVRFTNYIDETDLEPGMIELRDCGIKAFIQIRLYDNDQFAGYFLIEDLTDKRVWSLSDIAFANTISKIISSFYQKNALESKLNDSLYVDSLTGYKNLNSFKQEADTFDFKKKPMVLFNMDVRKFALINESEGFMVGDRVIKLIANTLDSVLDDGEIFCRIADDKYAILLNSYNDNTMRIKDVIDIIRRNVSLIISKNIDFACGGYVLDDNETVSTALDKATYAKKIAKSLNSELLFYNEELMIQEAENKRLESRMRKSLEDGDFLVYFQPCYYVKTRKVCSMEALVRWNLDGKLISPGNFIPLFEKNGFITELDFYVYETVCKTISEYMSKGYEVPTISVNVSRKHIDNKDFVNELNILLDKYNIPRAKIGLELTESLFVENEALMLSFVDKLHKEGYRIYMDDFGVAYSTLNLLGRMHVDVIKLDKSFIDDAAYNKNEQIIIANIIRMAKELGIRVLSEGIETEIQLDKLSMLQCDYAQGYWFAKPKAVDEVFPAYLKKIN